MLMTTSAEWTPSDSAWRQAASTAAKPSVRTAARIFTICRSPSSELALGLSHGFARILGALAPFAELHAITEFRPLQRHRSPRSEVEFFNIWPRSMQPSRFVTLGCDGVVDRMQCAQVRFGGRAAG
jgi:hypothetical protein